MITEKLNIPMPLVCHALGNRFDRQLSVYVYLKSLCTGKLRLDPKHIEACAKELQVSTRTVRNAIKSLREHKWITLNPKNNLYYISGFRFIMKKYGYVGRTGVHMESKREDFKTFKEFLVAAKIKHLQNIKQVQEWKTRLAASNIAQAKKPSEIPFLLSNSLFSKFLGVSISKARTLKRKAREAGYITIKKNTCVPVNLKSQNVKGAISVDVEGTQGLIYSHKYRKYFRQLPDFVDSTNDVKLAQRKK